MKILRKYLTILCTLLLVVQPMTMTSQAGWTTALLLDLISKNTPYNYEDTLYSNGGMAYETTDENGNGDLDGLLLDGLTLNTYYTAGNGYIYCQPQTDGSVVVTMVNATIQADYGILATTDMTLVLVGENTIDCAALGVACSNDGAVSFFDLTISGAGQLSLTTPLVGFMAKNITMESASVYLSGASDADEDAMGVCAIGTYADSPTAFVMTGGLLDIDCTNFLCGLCAVDSSLDMTDGTLSIHDTADDAYAVMIYEDSKTDLSLHMDFTNAPDAVVQLTGISGIQSDAVTITQGAGSIQIPCIMQLGTSSQTVSLSDDVNLLHIYSTDDAFISEVHGALIVDTCIQSCLNSTYTSYKPLSFIAGAGTSIEIPAGITLDLSPMDTLDIANCTITGDGTLLLPEGYEVSDSEETEVYTDLVADSYYYDAVLWAVEHGISADITGSSFLPGTDATRAQTVTFIWRAMGSPEATIDNPFSDVDADAYYYDAVLWAVENGITAGTTETTFSPDATATRGQIVTFLWRNAGEPVVEGDSMSDVAEDSYCYNAVLWAVANGITTGYEDGTFQPNTLCSRGHIITFLYRNLGV